MVRHDCVGDYGIGDGAQAWKFLQERFQSVETSTVVTLVTQLVRLQLEDAEDLNSCFIREQELLTRLEEAGKRSQRPSSTPWSSMVCQWGMKVLLYRKAFTRQRSSQSWGKGCRTSMRAQHRGTRDKVVQWHWHWSVTSRRDPRKETTLFVGSLDTLPRTARGRRQHNAASVVGKVT